MKLPALIIFLSGLAACQGEAVQADDPLVDADAGPAAAPVDAPTGQWGYQASGAQAGLHFDVGDERRVALSCPEGTNRLTVSLPMVPVIDSEERVTIGSGKDVAPLVVQDAGGPGVTASGPIPADLAAKLENGFAALYGAWSTGQLPPPDPALTRQFISSCAA